MSNILSRDIITFSNRITLYTGISQEILSKAGILETFLSVQPGPRYENMAKLVILVAKQLLILSALNLLVIQH